MCDDTNICHIEVYIEDLLCRIFNCCRYSTQVEDKGLFCAGDFFLFTKPGLLSCFICSILNPDLSKLTPRSKPGTPCSSPFIPLRRFPCYCDVWSSLYNEVSAGQTAVTRMGAFQRHCGPGHTEIDHLRTCHSCLYQIWIIKWPEAVKCIHCLLFSRCF